MNAQVIAALFKDALYQVLDNKVFRLLVILIGVMVLPTFLVAAREESLVVLFGWREFFYEDIFSAFGQAFPGKQGAAVQLIGTVQGLLVDNLAGTFGIVFAIAATAFFMPRMIEKGAADTVFSKPVSRLTLMLSRYFSGLLFVSLLAVLLVGGMHLGLLLNSGYSDPGFLWSALTLIYLFALLHAFSIAVGVLTRSTVAAILLSLMFFVFTGCVHNGWQARRFFLEVVEPELQAERGETSEGSDEEETMKVVAEGLFSVINVLHYVLPKTNDASVIAASLRRKVETIGTAFFDEVSALKILVPPKGFTKVEPDPERPNEIARWGAEQARATITIERFAFGDKKRREAIEELESRLESEGITEFGEERVDILGRRTDVRTWTLELNGSAQAFREYFFYGRGYLFILSIEADRDWMDDEARQRDLTAFTASFTQDEGDRNRNPFQQMSREARWGGPLKYNLWFSVGSSLAFLLIALGLGWWRLARIDF